MPHKNENEDIKAGNGASSLSPLFGIDFGTTYSSIAWISRAGAEVKELEVAPSPDGDNSALPSVVFYDPNVFYGPGSSERPYVGTAAEAHREDYPPNFIFAVKRLLNDSYTTLIDNLFKRAANKYRIAVDQSCSHSTGQGAVVKIVHKTKNAAGDEEIVETAMQPQEIITEVYKKLKQVAEKYPGCPSEPEVVITHPSSFAMVKIMTDAAAKAGFKVVGTIEEPIAALMYHFSLQTDAQLPSGYSLVFDYGGGTIDVALVKVSEDGRSMTVTNSDSESYCGGEDLDWYLLNHFTDEFRYKTPQRRTGEAPSPPFDISSNAAAQLALLKCCRAVKEDLSNGNDEVISQNHVFKFKGYDERTLKLSRSQFESICGPKMQQAVGLITKLLKKCNVAREEIQCVVLAGGSAQIPFVKREIGKLFPNKQGSTMKRVAMVPKPQLAVAFGATVWGAVKYRPNFVTNAVARLVDESQTIRQSIGVRVGRGGEILTIIPQGAHYSTKANPISKDRLPRPKLVGVLDGKTNVTVEIYGGEFGRAQKLGALAFPVSDPAKPIELDFTVTHDGGMLEATARWDPTNFPENDGETWDFTRSQTSNIVLNAELDEKYRRSEAVN